MKHPPSVILWEVISIKGTTIGTTVNGVKYLNIIKEKLPLYRSVHLCTIIMQDRDPCHRSKILTDFFLEMIKLLS